MIHARALLYIIGQFLLGLAAAMLVPLFYGLSIGDNVRPFIVAIAITAITGVALVRFAGRPNKDLSQREGVLLVSIVWVVSSLFGCLPFYLSPYFPDFTGAFFETASGFTTTGATVLPVVEVLTNSLQFWRCFTHWLGGMGIVLLAIAILPLVGVGGMPLYRAEFSGARSKSSNPGLPKRRLLSGRSTLR